MINAILWITGVVFLFYARTLDYSYCIDDVEIASESKPEQAPKNLRQRLWLAWRGRWYNPYKPLYPHLVCFVLHWVNCLLVYFAFGRNTSALLASLLFAINPAGCQGSVWLSGKYYATAATCVLAMYAFKFAAPLFYWLSFSWSLSTLFAPIIFIFTPWWWLAFLFPVLGVFKFRYCAGAIQHKAEITPKRTKKIHFRRLILYFKTLGYYFCMGLFPFRLGVYHALLYTYGLTEEETAAWERPDIYFFVGLGVIYILITNLLWNYTPAVFGLFWFVLFISQWCNCPITIQQAVAERYIYLPLAGLMFFLSNMIMSLPDPTWRAVAFTIAFAYYAGRLFWHLPSFRDIYYQVDYNLLNFPTLYAVWTWKGQVERLRGSFFTALEAWFRGWRMRKHDFRLATNIAILLAHLGHYDEAEDFLRLAGQNLPEDIKEQAINHLDGIWADIQKQRVESNPKIIRPKQAFYKTVPGGKMSKWIR